MIELHSGKSILLLPLINASSQADNCKSQFAPVLKRDPILNG
jgi:hypothetical protein